MKIALMSGAVKNAGDYLITERTQKLLKHFYPDAEIRVFIRNYPLNEEKIAEINAADAMVIGGGPCYKWDLYPQSLPLVPDLSVLKPKMFLVGSGWYGNTTRSDEVFGYRFSDSSRILLDRIVRDTGILGCRDYYSMRVLKANGYGCGRMTGCPAWYDLDRISQRLEPAAEIRKIAVSDPADVIHHGEQSMEIVSFLRKKYPDAELIYLFHRGAGKADDTGDKNAWIVRKMRERLEADGVKVYDIAYSADGFHYYDDCDLHVGHRVHAHIYNLSQRKRTVLVEEDSRGTGVNEALGLWGIRAYSRKKGIKDPVWIRAYNRLFDYTRPNPYVISELDDYLDYLDRSHGEILDLAFSRMEYFYQGMCAHIKIIGL